MGFLLEFQLLVKPPLKNGEIVRELLVQIKDYVFEHEGLVKMEIESDIIQGGVNVEPDHNDVWKMLDILFKMTEKYSGLVFSIFTDNCQHNPILIECLRNEVIPKTVNSDSQFAMFVAGMNGVLHLATKDLFFANTNSALLAVFNAPSETRNILITEAVMQKVRTAQKRNFGMARFSVTLPIDLAYIAKERPDLLSIAIRDYSLTGISEKPNGLSSDYYSDPEHVMVQVELCSKDGKIVNEMADIDAPRDIVSFRILQALKEFHSKHFESGKKFENGRSVPYLEMADPFERSRFAALYAQLCDRPYTISQKYQAAYDAITEEHRQNLRKIVLDSSETSSSNDGSACSGDDEDNTRELKRNRQKKFHKKRQNGEIGKKRSLVPVLTSKSTAPAPLPDYELMTPASSRELRNFEMAVNGDDVFYKMSSDDKSLGEEEDLEFFATRSKKQPTPIVPNGKSEANSINGHIAPNEDSEDGFDVADLPTTAPPLATNDEFDDL